MGSCSSAHATAFQKTVEVPGLKIAIVGDPEVGKTGVLARYIHNQFSPVYITTYKVVIENVVRKLNVPSHATVPITFWDIPGKEDLPLHQSYFRDLDAVIVVVDLNDPVSVESGKLWRQVVLNTASFTSSHDTEDHMENRVEVDEEENERQKVKSVNDIPFLLLGNKHDLLSGEGREEVTIIPADTSEKTTSDKTAEIHDTSQIRMAADCVKLLEEVAVDGFVGSVMVSAKANDLSVHAAIQNFLRHILEKHYVERRWQVAEKIAKTKRPRYEHKPQLRSIGIEEIDAEFTKAEEIIYRVTSLQHYQDDSLTKFAEQCVDIGVIETTKEASMQNCLVALRDKLSSMDLKLKLTLQDDFCVLEVKASTEDAELDKTIRYTIKTFNKEYAAVTKAMLIEFPLAQSKLKQIDTKVEKLCEQYEVPAPKSTNIITVTSSDLQTKAIQVERNRAVIQHTTHICHDNLAHIQRSVKQAKAAFVW